MARYIGKLDPLTSSYNVTDYYPLDTRMLVPTYADLTLEANWVYEGASIVYNGMIVAVGSNTEDPTKNGIYRLFDEKNPSEYDIPVVTDEANWHKLCELSDLDDYVKNDDAFAALRTSVSNNQDAIAALLGGDSSTNKSVVEIIDAAVAEQEVAESSTKFDSLGALTKQVITNTSALSALLGDTGTVEDKIVAVVDDAVKTAASNKDTTITDYSLAALTTQVIDNKKALAGLDQNISETINQKVSSAIGELSAEDLFSESPKYIKISGKKLELDIEVINGGNAGLEK